MASQTNLTGFIDLPTRLRADVEQWKRLRWQLMCDLRVAIPAVVVSFNATKQTVRVQPAIRENINVNSVPTPVDIPILGGDAGQEDIPVVMPRGGGYSITLPIQAGDECLLVFADDCIDAWWQSGGTANAQMMRRRHHLSDALAIMGCWSQPRVLPAYAASSLQIRSDDGTNYIEVAASGVVNVHCQTANINASTQANVTAPTIDLNGNVNISGTLGVGGATTLSSTTTIQGKIFLTHEHTGVTTGGGVTGPVA